MLTCATRNGILKSSLTFYAFLFRRPQDSRAWPVIWEHRGLAEREPFRVSEITEVELSEITYSANDSTGEPTK